MHKQRTFAGWIAHLRNLYGNRNDCLFHGGLSQRLPFLNQGLYRLGEVLKKNPRNKKQQVGKALARIVARTIGVTQHFRNLPVAEMLARKYATGRCSYCHMVVCACPETKRQAAKLAEVSKRAKTITIKGLCTRLNATYGTKNRAVGIDKLLWHLAEEIGELTSLEQNLAMYRLTPEEMRTQFALEAADVIAWAIALANFFDIDLEAALEARYGTVCWHCKHCPCNCLLNARHRRLPPNWKKMHR